MMNFLVNKFVGKNKRIVNINKIIIPVDFLLSPPKESKMSWKMKSFAMTGKLQSSIVLDKNWNLVDGYTSYIIARKLNMKMVKVQFVKE